MQELVDRIGFNWFHVYVAWMLGLAYMTDAMEVMLLSILSPQLHCEWAISPYEQAMLSTAVFTGMGTFSPIFGRVADTFGRRKEAVLCVLLAFYFGFLSSFSTNYYWLVALRFLVGGAVGGTPHVYAYYAEFLTTTARSSGILFFSCFWALGSLFEAVLALVIMPSLGWRWLLRFTAIPSILFGLVSLAVPESPYYMATIGDWTGIRKVLHRMIRFSKNRKALETEVEEFIAPNVLTDGSQPAETKDHVGIEQPEATGVLDELRHLFSVDFRTTTIPLFVIWFVYDFIYYGIVLLTTELINVENGGCTSHLNRTRAEAHFQQCQVGCQPLTKQDYLDVFWSAVTEVPGTLLCIVFLWFLGRKTVLCLCFVLFAGALVPMFFCTGGTLLSVSLYTARGLAAGGSVMPYLYTSEVYPTYMRAFSLGWCYLISRLGAMGAPFISQVLLLYSLHLTIGVFVVLSLVGAAASILLPIETKGRYLH